MRTSHAHATVLLLGLVLLSGCGSAPVNTPGSKGPAANGPAANTAPEANTASAQSNRPAGNGTEQATGTPEAVRHGLRLYQKKGCWACHAMDGRTQIGPTFKGLYGSERVLVDGSKVTADDAYLKDAILDHPKQVVKGFEEADRPQVNELNESEVNALIETIKSLK